MRQPLLETGTSSTGTMVLRLHLMPGAERARARTVRSVIDRVRAMKTFSVAEIGDTSNLHAVLLGVTWIGRHAGEGERAFQQLLQHLDGIDALIISAERVFQRLDDIFKT